jgi:hypothetical protein
MIDIVIMLFYYHFETLLKLKVRTDKLNEHGRRDNRQSHKPTMRYLVLSIGGYVFCVDSLESCALLNHSCAYVNCLKQHN